MDRNRMRQWTVVVVTLATLVVNGLANALPFNGLSTKEVSDSFQVYFVPAGYVFAIWGVIYLGMIAYALYQMMPAQADNPRLKAIFPWFVVSSVANMTWLLAWHYLQFGLSVAIILVFLISLIIIYTRLEIGRPVARPRGENLAVGLPFRVYLGWLSVATIADVTAWLDFVGWNRWGLSEETWAVMLLVVASLIGLLVAITRRDAAYLAVFVWAFAGIAVKQAAAPMVANAAWGAAVLAGVLMLVCLVWRPARSSA